MFDPKDLARYPEQPGVYLMKDTDGAVLYVGKAKNLKNRLKQYFGQDDRIQIPHLLAHTVDIETIITASETEALLLESRLIKRFRPKYNVLFKDDRSELLLRIGVDHPWPNIELVREKEEKPPRLFGPYNHARDTKQLLDLVVRLFQLRQCSDEVFRQRKVPCLLYQLRRCTAPCVGKVSADEYALQVQEAIQFLEGRIFDVRQALTNEMQAASDSLEFERAGQCLHRIQLLDALSKGMRKRRAVHDKRRDVFGVWIEGSHFAFSVMHYAGEFLEYGETFLYKVNGYPALELLEQLIIQYYTPETIPSEVVLPPGDFSSLGEALFQLFGKKILLSQPISGKRRAWVELSCENARARITRSFCGKERRVEVLEALTEKLSLKRFPLCIDCFDASHLAGKERVAACVRYVDGVPAKPFYRLFTIRQVSNGDDLALLREAVRRRYSSCEERGEALPDMVLVDGGKNQKKAVIGALRELSLVDIEVVSIAKDEARHDKGMTSELLYTEQKPDPIRLSVMSQELLFLQSVRDEAHRFVISFHRKHRNRSLFASELDGIPGVGEVTRKRLLKAFKSIEELQKISPEEISNKASVRLEIAKRIQAYLSVIPK